MFPSQFGSLFGSMFGGHDPFMQMEHVMQQAFPTSFSGHRQPVNQGLPPQVALQQEDFFRATLIEEIRDDEFTACLIYTSRTQPIVEEPDEDGFAQQRQERRDRYHANEPHMVPAATFDMPGSRTSGADIPVTRVYQDKDRPSPAGQARYGPYPDEEDRRDDNGAEEWYHVGVAAAGQMRNSAGRRTSGVGNRAGPRIIPVTVSSGGQQQQQQQQSGATSGAAAFSSRRDDQHFQPGVRYHYP